MNDLGADLSTREGGICVIGDGWRVRVIGLFALASAGAATAHAQIPGLRLGVHPGMTRAVLDLVEEAPYQVLLAPDARSLAIVVPNQGEHPRMFGGRKPGRAGLVQAVAIDPDSADETVVLLRLARAPGAVRTFALAEDDGRPLYRVVVDVTDDSGGARTPGKGSWTPAGPGSGWRQLAASGRALTSVPSSPVAQMTQAPPHAPLPTDYDSAFRAMMANPANLDLTFRFAELALAEIGRASCRERVYVLV